MALFKLSEVSEEERRKYLQSIGIDADKFQNAQETKTKNEQKSDNLLPIEKKSNSDELPIWQRYTVNNNETTNEENKKASLPPPTQKNNSVFQDILGVVKNAISGASSGIKQIGNYIENANEHNSADYKGNRAKQYLTSKNVNELDKAIYKSQDEFKNNVLFKNNNQDKEEKVETNLVKKAIQDSIQEDTENIALEQEKMSNGVTKKLGELAPSIGQMGVGMVANAVNPVLGAGYFLTSSGGSYLDEAKQRGMTDEQAFQFGTIMGGVESATELIGLESFKKAGIGIKSLITGGSKGVGKEVAKTSLKTVLKDYGIGIADNFIQEAIIDPIQEVVAAKIGGEDKADWENMGQQMLQDGINGALVAMITGGIGLGINSCTSVGEKLSNGKKVTQQEYKQAVQDAINGGVKIEDSINDGVSQSIYKNAILNDLKASNLSNETKNEIQQYIKENKITEEQYEEITQSLKQEQMTNEEQIKSKQFTDYGVKNIENDNIKSLLDSANQNQLADNEDTRKLINTMKDISNRNDISFKFNSELDSQGLDGKIIRDSNGKLGIEVNPNSSRALEYVVTHEVIHPYVTNEMRDIVTGYASKNADFNNAISDLKKLYGTEDITDEVVADAGAKLFGNQESLNQITASNPNFIKRVYNRIVQILDKFTGYKNEKLVLKDFKSRLETAMKENNVTMENGTENYLLSENAKNELNEIITERREIAEKNPKQFIKLKDNTIKALVDYGISDYPMMARRGHVRENVLTPVEAKDLGYSIKGKHFHGIGADTYLNIIDSMDNPIGVYQYTEKGKYDESNFIVLTPIKINGVNAIVPVEINQRGQHNNIEIDLNRIKSVYSKDSNDYINNLLKENKIKEIFNGSNSHQTSLINNSIPSSNEEVNTTNNNYIQGSENNSGSFNLPEVQDGYTRLYRGINGEYDSNYDTSKLDNSNGYESWTDNYELAKAYGDNVYYIDVPTSEIKNSIIDEDSTSETYGDRNLIYKNDKPVGIKGKHGNEYMLFTDHENHENIKYNKINSSEGFNKSSFSIDKDNQGRILTKYTIENTKNSQIRDENGNLLLVFHGSPNGTYEQLKEGTYFTANKDYAQRYMNTSASSISSGKIENNPKVYEAYLNIEKPFDISNPEARKIYIEDYIKGGNAIGIDPYMSNEQYNNIKNIDWTEVEDLKDFLKENGYDYDGIIADEGGDGGYGDAVTYRGKSYIPFYESQIIKANDNNSKYSKQVQQDGTGSTYRNFMDKTFNFGEKGTTTESRQILPIDNKILENRKQEIINKAQQIEKTNPDFQGLVDEIKNNYLGKDFDYNTYKQMNEYLDGIKPKEKDILEITTFNDSVDRRKTYMKYKNDTSDFNSNEVNLALDTIKANRNDKRTVSQWKKVAEQIGEQLAVNEKTAEEVENTAFKSWFDLQPTKNITRYDNKTKSNLGFQKFTADDWVNTIYKTYNEQASKNVKQIQDNTINQTQQTIPTNKVERIYENTPGEEVNYTEMERPNGKIRKHYRSIIESSNTTAEAKKIAKELMGVDTYVKTSNKYNTEIADRNIETNGPEKALTSLTTNVNDNKKITAVDIATGERLIEYFSKIGDKDRLQEAIQTTAMAGTEAGQAVQAMSLLNHQTPQGQVVWIQRSIDKVNKDLAKRNKNGAQFDFTPEMQQKILNSTKENLQDNINEVYEELGKQVPKSHIEQLNEWRYFSMLANPKTHIRNVVGNIVMGKVQDTKNKIAGGLESVFLRNSDERNHTIKRASKEVRQFAKNDIKNVESELGLNDNKYNPKSRLQNAQRTFKSNILENTLGKAFDFNSKLLEAEDGIGLKSAYSKALAEYITANKLDINNISDKDLQKARNYAIKQAQEATFHQECQIASMLNTLENKNKVTQVMVGGLIPFKKTPMNVAITGYQYSPLGLMTSLTKGSVDLRKGKITANQYIDNISKGLTGTGIALLGYALTEAGILKASGGDDDKEKFEEQQGKQSYSIQIGDNTYSLDWLAPAGIPLFIGSELYQIGKAKEENGEVKNQNQFISSLENIANAGMTAMNPMSEMSMVSGLVSTLKSYAQDPMQGLSNTLVNMGKSYVNQMFPTALGQVSKTLDDKERSTTSTESGILTKAVDSTKNQIMSKIPGLRQMLPIATDVWGNEKEQKGNYIDNAVLPWNKKEITTNSTDKALTELYDKTGESSVLPDSYINKTLTYDKQKYRLTDQEYAELKKEYGKTSYAIVSGLTKSSEFNNMSEEQQVKAISEAYKYSKAKIKSTYANWNDIDTEDSTAYKKVQDVVKNGGDAKDYFLYVGQTLNAKKEKEKVQILKNSNIGSKKAIYVSTIGNDDDTYSILDNTNNFNINNYLDYKLQDFSSDKEDDGTINGKTVSGSAKNKFYDYMDDSNFTYDQKLLLTGMKYKVTNTERENIFDIINEFDLSSDEKLEIMSKMKGFKIYNDGRVSF